MTFTILFARYADEENNSVVARTVESGDVAISLQDHPAMWSAVLAASPLPYQPPTVAPKIISDRQFFQQLAIDGLVTYDEALAAVGPGVIPGALDLLIQQLPSDQQFSARMLLAGATQFDRTHPMVSVISSAFGWSAEQVSQFWSAAAAL